MLHFLLQDIPILHLRSRWRDAKCFESCEARERNVTMNPERTSEVDEHRRQDDEGQKDDDRHRDEGHEHDRHPGHRVKPPRPFGAK